jgi:drug/metabolite transporter (DMT)-like permease
VVVPVVVGLATGDSPAGAQVAGIVVAIAGVVLASGPELSGRAGARPLLLAAVAAVGFGLALLFIAKGSAHSTVMTLVAMRATSVTVLASGLAVLAVRGRRPGPDARGSRPTPVEVVGIVLVGAGDLTANLTYGLASTKDAVSIVAVLGSLYPVFTVLLARFLHGERLGRIQVAGVAGALAGVVLIAAGDRI